MSRIGYNAALRKFAVSGDITDDINDIFAIHNLLELMQLAAICFLHTASVLNAVSINDIAQVNEYVYRYSEKCVSALLSATSLQKLYGCITTLHI